MGTEWPLMSLLLGKPKKGLGGCRPPRSVSGGRTQDQRAGQKKTSLETQSTSFRSCWKRRQTCEALWKPPWGLQRGSSARNSGQRAPAGLSVAQRGDLRAWAWGGVSPHVTKARGGHGLGNREPPSLRPTALLSGSPTWSGALAQDLSLWAPTRRRQKGPHKPCGLWGGGGLLRTPARQHLPTLTAVDILLAHKAPRAPRLLGPVPEGRDNLPKDVWRPEAQSTPSKLWELRDKGWRIPPAHR